MIEIRQILEDLGMPVISMKEAGVDPEIIEDGTTFEENALIKAREVAKLLPNDIVLADDSGLEVDALNKEPGIYSAQICGRKHLLRDKKPVDPGSGERCSRGKENRKICLRGGSSVPGWYGKGCARKYGRPDCV